MVNAILHELGARVMRDLHQENVGKPRWRKTAIALRWYDQYLTSQRKTP